MTPEASLEILHQGLVEFITHATFGYSIRSAHRELVSDCHRAAEGGADKGSSTQTLRHPTLAQRYRVKFGNPFPGPYHNDAHHCVDLIYQFDAFHDDLIAQDRKEAESGYDGVSNLTLRRDIQDYWINFIVGDVGNIDEQSALVYQENRLVTMEGFKEYQGWVKEDERLDLIGRYRRETMMALRRVMSLAS